MPRFSQPPDDDELYALLNLGLALYGAGKPFEAHEVWEYAWRAEVGRTKLTLQAMIQIAAGMHKHSAGVPGGTCKLLAKAQAKVREIGVGSAAWCGVDLVALDRSVTAALEQADAVYSGRGARVDAPPMPARVSPDGILYLHGFASSPGSKKAQAIAGPLAETGFDVAVPDQNEGDFRNLTISRAIDLARRHMFDRTLIIGSSFGGYVASLLAERDDRVKAMVLMAPAFDFASTLRRRHGPEAIETWSRDGVVDVDHHATGERAAIGFGLLEDADEKPRFPKIRVPTYILHGEGDDTVPCAVSRTVAEAHPEHVTLDVVDDEHGLVDSAPRALAAARRFIEALALRPARGPIAAADAMGCFRADPRFAED